MHGAMVLPLALIACALAAGCDVLKPEDRGSLAPSVQQPETWSAVAVPQAALAAELLQETKLAPTPTARRAPELKKSAVKKSVHKDKRKPARSAKRRASTPAPQPVCLPWAFDPSCHSEHRSR